MDTLAKLVSKRKLGRVCRVGTWIVAIIGIIQVSILSYNNWHIYLQSIDATDQIPQGLRPPFPAFLTYLPNILANVAVYIFYCIVLYAASVVFEAIGAQIAEKEASKKLEEQELEGIVYTPLKREDILKQRAANHQ